MFRPLYTLRALNFYECPPCYVCSTNHVFEIREMSISSDTVRSATYLDPFYRYVPIQSVVLANNALNG